LRWWPDQLAFFRGVRTALRDLNLPLYFPQMPRGKSVRAHAKCLADYVYQLPQKTIYIVGYSMGALDARYFIHHFDPEHRVKKLTTVAGAHGGTYLAEWALSTEGPLQWFVRLISRPSLLDLTREAGERFNKELKNRDDIEYRSYACVRRVRDIALILRGFAWKLYKVSGQNDFLIPLTSASWLNFQGVLQSDHMEVIGWNFGLPSFHTRRPFNHRLLYREIVQQMLDPEFRSTLASVTAFQSKADALGINN
jgi:triacylglycerol lipase